MTEVCCHYCGRPLDPLAPSTLQAVWGWEHRADSTSRRGGSDVRHRQHFERYAHNVCVDFERNGVSARQETLV